MKYYNLMSITISPSGCNAQQLYKSGAKAVYHPVKRQQKHFIDRNAAGRCAF